MPSAVTCVQVTLKYRCLASIAFLEFNISKYIVALHGILESEIQCVLFFPPRKLQLASPPLFSLSLNYSSNSSHLSSNLVIFFYFLPCPYHPPRTHWQGLCTINSTTENELVNIHSPCTYSFHFGPNYFPPSLRSSIFDGFSPLVSTPIYSLLPQYGRQLLRWPSWYLFPSTHTHVKSPPLVFGQGLWLACNHGLWKSWWDVTSMTTLHETVTSTFLENSLSLSLPALMKQDTMLGRPIKQLRVVSGWQWGTVALHTGNWLLLTTIWAWKLPQLNLTWALADNLIAALWDTWSREEEPVKLHLDSWPTETLRQ